jgi:hypothetical protein
MDTLNAAYVTVAEVTEVTMDRASTDQTDAAPGRTIMLQSVDVSSCKTGGPRVRLVVLIASLASVTLGGASSAFAQRVIEAQPDDVPYYEESVESAPPVYRYRSDSLAVVPVRPLSCGEFRYWNGERCVDARVIPPDVR